LDSTSLNRALTSIENGSSISAVSEFLRSRGVSHSAGSWEQLKIERIIPALKKGKLTDEDIRTLLREAEDFGRQHIFLFEPTSAASGATQPIRPDRIKRFLRSIGKEDVIDSVRVIGLPRQTDLVDVHFDEHYVAFKFVERRRVILHERVETPDGYQVRNVPRLERAVDVVTLFDSEILEFRIATISGTQDYNAIRDELWNELQDYIPRSDFKERDLSKLRRKFVVRPSASVRSLVRVRRASGQDRDGVKFDVGMAKPTGDLLDSTAAVDGIEKLASPIARLGNTFLGFLPQQTGVPRRELGVHLTAAVNEISVLMNCTREEYEYIRGQIARYS
jgi:hypothetical protein